MRRGIHSSQYGYVYPEVAYVPPIYEFPHKMESKVPIQTHQSVGELVVESPRRSRVFERFGIDYCCGGKRSLADACSRANLNPQEVIEELEQVGAIDQSGHQPLDPGDLSLSDLADHIELTHHDFLRTELVRIDQLTAKVASVHGSKDPRLVQLHEVFKSFRDELMMHMSKEEQILFPIIRQMESTQRVQQSHCGSVQNPIRQMESEHDDAGDALSSMRGLTDGYAVNDDACNTHRAMLEALEHLERDMHAHIHKENNILFPRAVRLEDELASKTCC